MSIDYEYDWTRVEALLKTWPGLGRRPSPAEVEALVTAYAYPNGRDRAGRCDPLELEDCLRELMQEDEKGAHPMPKIVGARIGLRRARAHHEVAEALDDLYKSEPAEDWVVAHALARGSSVAALMVAVAERHGRNIAPRHDPAACDLCEVERLEDDNAKALQAAYGSEWRSVDEALLARLAFLAELDERFPWRVKP